MYNARVGVYYKKNRTSSTIEYFMDPNVNNARCVFIDNDNMLDIDTFEVYPVVPRNERGYISSDIELNTKYVISYEKAKKIDFETYKKSINAKIDYYMENEYNRIVNDVVKREKEFIADKKYKSTVDKNLKEVVGDSFVDIITAHYEKVFFKMDCDDLKKKLESVKQEVRDYYDNIDCLNDCNKAVKKVKQLERKIKHHYKKS